MKKGLTKKAKKDLQEISKYDDLNIDLETTIDYQNFNKMYDEISKKKPSSNKKVKVLIIILFILIISFSILLFFYLKKWEILDVELLNYDKENQIITLKVKTSKDNNVFCALGKDSKNLKYTAVTNSFCTPRGNLDSTTIYFKKDGVIFKTYEISSLTLDASFVDKKIYLAPKDTYTLKTNLTYLGQMPNVRYEVVDENILDLNTDKLTSKKDGETKINLYIEDKLYSSMDVVVTSLIEKRPKKFNTKKSYLTCNRYTTEEAKILDDILSTKINNVGNTTRASVVEAARFLTLDFPYRIHYFFENGRVSGLGENYADGEGRYYHKGLYLSKDKFKDIKYVFAGPAIWGCGLTNYEDYGIYVYGKKMPNGLDCSGFVSWVLLNGGFDVGDRGAGDTYEDFQMTDLGNRQKVTKQLVESGQIKVGDLLNWWGHIAIIIGIDENNYYVAESLDTYGGVVVKTYKKTNLPKDWTYVMLMDDVYKQDGKITNMWY